MEFYFICENIIIVVNGKFVALQAHDAHVWIKAAINPYVLSYMS